MKKNLALFFCMCFLGVMTLTYLLLQWQKSQIDEQHNREVSIIQDDVRERFKLLVEAPLAIGIVSAEYFSSGKMDERSYQQLASNIVHNFDEMIGLNLLDAQGRITRVYPTKENQPGLGKVSQNYLSFSASAKRGEPYWLSAPFELYQGPDGFTFYIPIYVKGKLFGWVAPVISVDRFFSKFMKSEFLNTYHLIIQDKITGRPYFQSAPLPKEHLKDSHQLNSIIKGREINFISWRKSSLKLSHLWLLTVLISLIISGLLTYSVNLYQQRKFIRDQLADIETLLKLTIKDATASFQSIKGQIDLMRSGVAPFSLEKVGKHVSYIETLMKQIEILQNISSSVDISKQDRTTLLPLFLELSTVWNDKLKEKNLLLNYNPEELADARVVGNKWLICHSIFGNILAKAISLSPSGADIDIKCFHEEGFEKITIHSRIGVNSTAEKTLSQGMAIAQKMTALHQGELVIDSQLQDQEIVTVKLSAL